MNTLACFVARLHNCGVPVYACLNTVTISLLQTLLTATIALKEAACAIVTDIGLDIIVVPCLILVIVFWGLFGAFVGKPDS